MLVALALASVFISSQELEPLFLWPRARRVVLRAGQENHPLIPPLNPAFLLIPGGEEAHFVFSFFRER